MLLRSVCVLWFSGWFCPLTPSPSCPFRGRGEDCFTPDPSCPFRGRGEDWAGFGLLSDTFSELEEVEDHEWAGAADIAVGGARKPVRDDSATGQFRDVDDAEGWLDAS